MPLFLFVILIAPLTVIFLIIEYSPEVLHVLKRNLKLEKLASNSLFSYAVVIFGSSNTVGTRGQVWYCVIENSASFELSTF